MGLVGVLILATALDYLAVKWQQQRELGRRYCLAGLSMLMELLGWLPVWLAITTEDPMVIAASVVGSGIGAFLGAGPAAPLGAERPKDPP